MIDFRWACPSCRTLLVRLDDTQWRCSSDSLIFEQRDGIWRFLTPAREAYYEQFMREYQQVREAEGRGSNDDAYYRALPFADLSGRFTADWSIRARSFNAFTKKVLDPIERGLNRSLLILDLGAGNGWLSYRLARRGHHVAAIDLLTNSHDGLGAHVHYDATFTPVQAEFDRLPFDAAHLDAAQFDLAIYNASLHYAVNYETALREALRVLKSDGQIVILDLPLYRSGESGAQMVREREAAFTQRFGFPSNALPNENYLTQRRLHDLAETLQLRWQIIQPFYGWRWHLRPLIARLRGRREPARFAVIVGQRWT